MQAKLRAVLACAESNSVQCYSLRRIQLRAMLPLLDFRKFNLLTPRSASLRRVSLMEFMKINTERQKLTFLPVFCAMLYSVHSWGYFRWSSGLQSKINFILIISYLKS